MENLNTAFKKKVIESCFRLVDAKITEHLESIRDLQSGSEADSKSSAGDKHETGRAMVHLEQEKVAGQLTIFQQHKSILSGLSLSKVNDAIVPGSLIRTTDSIFFICIPLGRMQVDKKSIFAISEKSPIGVVLLGKKSGDTVSMNGISHSILQVL